MKPYEAKNILELRLTLAFSSPVRLVEKKPAPTIEGMLMDQPLTLDGYYF